MGSYDLIFFILASFCHDLYAFVAEFRATGGKNLAKGSDRQPLPFLTFFVFLCLNGKGKNIGGLVLLPMTLDDMERNIVESGGMQSMHFNNVTFSVLSLDDMTRDVVEGRQPMCLDKTTFSPLES